MSLADLSLKFNIKYNSIRNILNAFESSGRTNKKKFYKQSTRSKTPPVKKSKVPTFSQVPNYEKKRDEMITINNE